MYIVIPDNFKTKLCEDKHWESIVTGVIEKTEPYFLTTPPFFPYYTFHGVVHINRVLELSEKLISSNCYTKLSSRDIAILICAIIFHDLGMFIDKDGLKKLLFGEYRTLKILHLDDMTWEERWSVYRSKINRYSEKDLVNLFGNSESISIPSEEIENCTEKDLMVYGEFLRKYHHALAHHFACNGFMGCNKLNIFDNINVSTEIIDIIGLIARSHCIPMRDTEEYIFHKYTHEVSYPLNIPVYFLMSVLRLGDLLDASDGRAPIQLENRNEIISKISQNEWAWNQRISAESNRFDNIHGCLFIYAKPLSGTEFIKIEEWLKTIQLELDYSWATISEYYGHDKLELSIHRVNSNILEKATIESFEKNFVTQRASFVVKPDLLKLLIQPLYGDNPSFGVRELIQNAVDACNERGALEKGGYLNDEATIDVCIDSKEKTFTITDNGIGMTKDTILNYYLSVGSSYRYSEDYYDKFIDNSKSSVARSGKFGIGVLAMFLIGKTSRIITRNVDDDKGYYFALELEQNNIDIQRVECSVGTSIIIDLDDQRLNYFKTNNCDIFDYSNSHFKGFKWFEWYWFDNPIINYYIDGKKMTNNAILFSFEQMQRQQSVWFEYKGSFESVKWSYNWNAKRMGFRYDTPEAFCNGIAIPNIYDYYSFIYGCGLMIEMPVISVIDKQSKLRLSLSRHCLLEIPDGKSFIAEIYKYIIAQMLIVDFEDAKMLKRNFFDGFKYNYNCDYSYSNVSFVFSDKGYTLFSNPFLICAEVNRCFILCINKSIKKPVALLSRFNAPFCVKALGDHNRMQLEFYKGIFNGNIFSSFSLFYGSHPSYSENNTILHSKKPYSFEQHLLNWYNEKKVFNDIINKLPQYFVKRRTFVKEHDACVQNCYNIQHKNENIIIETDDFVPTILEYEITTKSIIDSNLIIDIIKEYLGEDIWIPFDMNERKKKFAKAFKELEKYMVNINHYRNSNP